MNFLTPQKLIVAVLFAIFLVGSWGSISESVQLSFVPRDQAGLSAAGRIVNVEGRVRRKLVSDVLWFPADVGEAVFLGDGIETKREASSLIELHEPARIHLKIGAETIVKMRTFMKKPLILLLEGEVEVSGETPESVYVSTGLKMEKIQVRKGSSTKVRRTRDGDLDVKTAKTDVENEQGMTEIGQSKDVWARTPEEDSAEVERISRPLKYPYPADQTVFFTMGSGRIAVFPQERCETGCRLRVMAMSGGEVLAREFKAGEDVLGVILYEKELSGDYRWVFDDGGKSEAGVFFIRPYSGEEMKRQMGLKRPIEVLTGL